MKTSVMAAALSVSLLAAGVSSAACDSWAPLSGDTYRTIIPSIQFVVPRGAILTIHNPSTNVMNYSITTTCLYIGGTELTCNSDTSFTHSFTSLICRLPATGTTALAAGGSSMTALDIANAPCGGDVRLDVNITGGTSTTTPLVELTYNDVDPSGANISGAHFRLRRDQCEN